MLDVDGQTGRGHLDVQRAGTELQALAAGQSIEVQEQAIELGSEAEVGERGLRIQRADDRAWDGHGATTPVRVYEVIPSRGSRAELVVDAEGWSLELVSREHGGMLRVRRRLP